MYHFPLTVYNIIYGGRYYGVQVPPSNGMHHFSSTGPGNIISDVVRQMDTEKFLSTVKVFSKLDHDRLQTLADHVEVKKFERGAIIVEQGVPGEYLWIIFQGSVKIFRQIGDKQQKELATLVPPDIFGEISLMSKSPTTAEVRAEEPCVVLRIPQEVVASVIRKNLSAAASVSRTSIERLTDNAHKLFSKS